MRFAIHKLALQQIAERMPRLLSITIAAWVFSLNASAQVTLNCTASYQISHSFSNGARWDMCWERQDREGIIYSDIHYTTPGGIARKVIDSAALAQIHVPYDDNGARYHDVSDFGLGTSNYLNNLQAADCPNGTRLQESGKNMICRSVYTDETSMLTASNAAPSEFLSVFSVSHVGAYNYIPEYRFHDNGMIEPVMGATGTLQRYGSNPAEGWTVRTGGSPVGISHLHNYYWRLDFDLGSSGTDDVFEEIEFVAESGSNTSFAKSVTGYSTEVARSMNPDTRRFWRVRDDTETNAEGLPISYDILPLDTGHRDTGPTSEPWTYDDIYVTQQRGCERFISHNPSDPGGCSSNGDVTDFINGESLTNEDLVVWFGITFHHIPRDEDEPRMHAHWNHFRIIPRDWTYESVNNVNYPPVVINPGDQHNLAGSTVNLQIAASDADGHSISYSHSGLPTGLAIDTNTGLITGTLAAALGTYPVTITATDTENTSNDVQFNWYVGIDPDNDGVGSSLDNCPATPNANQLDSDSDGDGDLCDATPYGECESVVSTDVPKSISSSGTPTIQSTLSTALNGSVSSLVIDNLAGTHSYMGDLTFTLTNPSNTSVQIIDPSCGSDNNFNLSLNDDAATAFPCPPTGGGTHLPSNSLAAFIGEPVAGTWTLSVADSADQDGGSLDSWGINVCTGNGGTPNPAFWEEGFESQHGWTQNPLGTDSGTTGQWSAGDPDETISNQIIMQPGNASAGIQAMVTNPAGGGSAGSNDVDSGVVSSKSPSILLPATGDLTFSFDYFFAHRSNSASDDYFRLKLVDASNNLLLALHEEFGDSVDREAQWTSVGNISLNAYLGQSVAFLVEAADDGAGSLLEAGLDNMQIVYNELDADADGITDALDNCPAVANNNQLDDDSDNLGNACDNWPDDPDNDIDGDGISGPIDNCPNTANSNQLNTDGDGLGDACDNFPNDPDNDFDGDGISGEIDNCPLTSNAGQENADGDTFGDICDAYPNDPDNDIDGDGIASPPDNCPTIVNINQANADGDALGDACDAFPLDPQNDIDGDGIGADTDNCPAIANSSQLDTDGDLAGNACDSDDDNDNLPDIEEQQHGTDALLADTDNDTLSDYEEVYTYATNPLLVDTDGDGYTDAEEIAVGRNPNMFDALIPLPPWVFILLGATLLGIYRLHSNRN